MSAEEARIEIERMIAEQKSATRNSQMFPMEREDQIATWNIRVHRRMAALEMALAALAAGHDAP